MIRRTAVRHPASLGARVVLLRGAVSSRRYRCIGNNVGRGWKIAWRTGRATGERARVSLHFTTTKTVGGRRHVALPCCRSIPVVLAQHSDIGSRLDVAVRRAGSLRAGQIAGCASAASER